MTVGHLEEEGMRSLKSPCCDAVIHGSRGDGVFVGSCSVCTAYVVRLNPRTGVEEWLDGKSPWTTEELRPIDRSLTVGAT